VQYADAFAVFDEVRETYGLSLDRMGTWDHGRKAFARAQMSQAARIQPRVGDLVALGVYARASHDGSGSLTFSAFAERLVCLNGMTVATPGARRLKIRHTVSAAARLGTAHAAIAEALHAFEELRTFTEHLERWRMTQSTMAELAAHLVPVADDDMPTTRQRNTREHLVDLWQRGVGNHGQTAWDAWNAVTEWTTHHAPAHNADNRAVANLWGSGHEMQQQAQQWLQARL
jgi:phage/plasmid-like protein (TIGR03299 family)